LKEKKKKSERLLTLTMEFFFLVCLFFGLSKTRILTLSSLTLSLFLLLLLHAPLQIVGGRARFVLVDQILHNFSRAIELLQRVREHRKLAVILNERVTFAHQVVLLHRFREQRVDRSMVCDHQSTHAVCGLEVG